jgi:hypothetical protein
LHRNVGVSLPQVRGRAALLRPRLREAAEPAPFSPHPGAVSALTGCDRFCNRNVAVNPLFSG